MKSSAIPAWLNRSGMSWEIEASLYPTETHLLMAAAASQGEILALESSGWEAPEPLLCRSSTPGDSAADYLEGVEEAISWRFAGLWSLLTLWPWTGHFTSSPSSSLPSSSTLCQWGDHPPFIHWTDTTASWKGCFTLVTFPVETMLSLAAVFCLNHKSSWLWTRFVEFSLSLFWQQESLSPSPVKFLPARARQSPPRHRNFPCIFVVGFQADGRRSSWRGGGQR